MQSIEVGLAIVTKDYTAICGKVVCEKGEKVTVLTGIKDAYNEVKVTKQSNKAVWVPVDNLLHIDILNKVEE